MDYKKLSEGIILSFVFLFAYGVLLSFSSYPYLAEIFLGNLSGSSSKNNIMAAKSENNILPKGMEIDAQAALSLRTNFSSKKVLLSKNADRKLSIASISKLMTALVVLENYDLGQTIRISKEAALMPEGRAALKEGETFFAKDLLYAMLIGSDNAAAYAFSESIGNEKFAELMNKKAKEIGLADSSFSNSTGLGLANFSTANDLARLAGYILQKHRSLFYISLMKDFDVYSDDGKIMHKVVSTNELLSESSDFGSRILGGKTGETRPAGQCLLLVVGSKDEESFLISVILNSKDRFGEMKKLINWTDENI